MGLRNFIFDKIIGTKFTIKLLDNIFMFSSIGIEDYFKSMTNLRRSESIRMSLLSIGIGYRKGDYFKAENWFLKNVLFEVFRNNELPICCFDIGANIGEYTSMLVLNFPSANVFSFEPNPITFELLRTNSIKYNNIKVYNFGFSSKNENGELFSYLSDPISGHASLSKEVFLDLYKNDKLLTMNVRLRKLDSFCIENNITKIDFMKIDTEGYELEILSGALDLISNHNVSVIQFEFNEMNLIKRINLKDFYELLKDFTLFRISDGALIDISKYKSEYEIFWYQDIVAVLNGTSALSSISKFVLK